MANSQNRSSDSPLLDHVAFKAYYGLPGGERALPDCCWDILIIREPSGQTHTILTGAITHPIPLDFSEGFEVMNLSFKANVFMPHVPARFMVNKGVVLQRASPRKVWIGSQAIELPTFNNAEAFVNKLVRSGLLASSDLVSSTIAKQPIAASERSVQRHFLQVTGMPWQSIRQIQRAWEAADLLRTNMRIADVAAQLGYTDQAHLTRSLKAILGQTPSAIANSDL